MRVLFLTRRAWPEVGGVEHHIQAVSEKLKIYNVQVLTISEKEIKYPKIRFIGLLYIWYWLFKKRKLILESDVVHCHDVFIWYLPFRFLFPAKPVYITFHGWEGKYPIPKKNILLKRISSKLSWGSIAVGKYIEKWYGVKANFIIYGGIDIKISKSKKNNKQSLLLRSKKILFVGRLEYDTGIQKLFDFLDKHKSYSVDFCGDGSLREGCARYGKVHGFSDPTPYYKKAGICFAGGYLVALETLNYNCKLMVGWDNPLKKDYWKLSPFLKKDADKWAKKQTWDSVTDVYLKLWDK